MSINFQKFNQEQLATIKTIAAAIDENPDMSVVIEFRGGFLPKRTYIAAQRLDRLDAIDIIPTTHTGALFGRNVALLTAGTINGIAEQEDIPEGQKRASVQIIQMAAVRTTQFMSQEDIAEKYHDWYMRCENIPADLTETALGLLFTAEILDYVAKELSGPASAMLAAMRESANATRH